MPKVPPFSLCSSYLTGLHRSRQGLNLTFSQFFHPFPQNPSGSFHCFIPRFSRISHSFPMQETLQIFLSPLSILCSLTRAFCPFFALCADPRPRCISVFLVAYMPKIINIQNATFCFLWYNTSVEVVPLGSIAAGILLMPWQ